jgi:hypothetical protein
MSGGCSFKGQLGAIPVGTQVAIMVISKKHDGGGGGSNGGDGDDERMCCKVVGCSFASFADALLTF